MVTVQITGFLTDFTGGARAIALDASPATVADALTLLWARHAALRDRIVTERDELRPHIGVFVNSHHIRHLQGLQSAVRSGDEITILPAISGGSTSCPGGSGGSHDGRPGLRGSPGRR
jgi:molybdopterin synthase sulfur carrier subunit